MDLVTRFLDEKGYGIVTLKSIQSGNLVCAFLGEIISYTEAIKREEKYDIEGKGCYMLFDKRSRTVIDPTSLDLAYGYSPYVNHANKKWCNLELKRIRKKKGEKGIKISLYATRNIKPGEELTFDYGDRRSEVIKDNPWLHTSYG